LLRAFAINQDAAIGRRGHGNLLAKRFHGDAFADDLVAMAQLASQQKIFFLQAPLLYGVANQDDDLLERERLLDKVEGAKLGGTHRGLDRAVPGNHDDGRRPWGRLQAAQRFEAVHSGEPHVQQQQLEITRGHAVQSFLGGADGFHVIALFLKDGRKRFADAGFVVHDEEMRSKRH
jgi:hypothetical protein